MDNQTTLEEQDSLRDTIENAIQDAPVVAEEIKSDRVRDDSGKFAKTTTDEEIAPVEPIVETKPRPSSWKKDYEEHWGQLDPALQDYIGQREADYAKGVSTYKNQWD